MCHDQVSLWSILGIYPVHQQAKGEKMCVRVCTYIYIYIIDIIISIEAVEELGKTNTHKNFSKLRIKETFPWSINSIAKPTVNITLK